MRDVTGLSPLISQFKNDFFLIVDFLKNPLQRIQSDLNWSWQRTVLIHAVLSVLAGILNGLIPPNIYNIAFGLIFMPLITFVTSHILTGFFYYYFQVFEKRTVNFLSLLQMVVLSNIPFLLIHTLSSFLPPVTLLGMAFSALLLVVGLTDKFQLEKKRSLKLVAVLYFMIFAVWLWEKIDVSRLSRTLSNPVQDIQ